MAEGVGFEPTIPRGDSGFQDRRHRPLGHPSATDKKGLQHLDAGRALENTALYSTKVHARLRAYGGLHGTIHGIPGLLLRRSAACGKPKALSQ